MDVAQSASFLSAMTYESVVLDYDDFPPTDSPVFILGVQYSVLYDLQELRNDVMSRLWFTYRKGFSPIGGTGPNYDSGWGCMLRCGQMMMAQTLIHRHLGRGWRWSPQKYEPLYQEILRLFQDKKSSCYSIQQIASMGVSEGKSVGQWFGPNTIAQVLKKLAAYDEWSSIAVHIALDNTVIMDDIRKLCKKSQSENKCQDFEQHQEFCQSESNSTIGATCTNSEGDVPSTSHPLINGAYETNKLSKDCEQCAANRSQTGWQPLLLIVPLRLGLSEINSVYVNSLKVCFRLPQSVGMIGGKPNHAHWFIGYVDDELVYLDPHTTQPMSDVTIPGETDESYHCECSCRMKIMSLDPSIAIGFYCGTEKEFDDLCQSIQKFIISGQKTPMFELHKERPRHWPVYEPSPSNTGATIKDYTIIDDRQYDTDEEFELL